MEQARRRVDEKPGVSLREWLVVGFGSLTMAFVPWSLGGVLMEQMHLLLAGGLLTFLAATMPLPSKWNGTDNRHSNGKNILRLLKSPVFWCCLCFLVYITIQGLNPAWVEKVGSRRIFWVEPVIPPVAWLPTGVDSRYEPMNAFRVLVAFAAAFSMMVGILVGVQRRQSILILLWVLVTSGLLMALVAIVQRLTDADKVLWTIDSPNRYFWGTYFYRNQGAAFLNLVLVACGVLYFYHAGRAARTLQRSGPHLLLFVFAIGLIVSVAMSYSRGGILFGGIVFLSLVCLSILRWLSDGFSGRTLAVSAIAFALIFGSAYMANRMIDWEAIGKRFKTAEESLQDLDSESRVLSTRATWQMVKTKPVTGWGAGSFRFIFPYYQVFHPEIYHVRYYKREGRWIGRRLYYYAHNDILQYPAEYGIIGCAFIMLLLLYLIFVMLLRSVGNAFAVLFCLIGVLAAFAHAFFDFIFQSPTYLVTFYVVLAGTVKLVSLDAERRMRRMCRIPSKPLEPVAGHS